jgi:hypothetical protein
MKKIFRFITSLLSMIFVCTGAASCISQAQPTVSSTIIGSVSLGSTTVYKAIVAGVTGRIKGRNCLILAAYSQEQQQTTLIVDDISDPKNPEEIGSLECPNPAVLDMALSGNTLFVSIMDRIWVVDLSDPSHPKEVSQYEPRYAVSQITLSGNLAFVATNINILVLDVSNPSEIKEVATYDLLPEALAGLESSGKYLYMITFDGLELDVIDVSNPVSPKMAGIFQNPLDPTVNHNHFQDVKILGKYAYLTAADAGLYILDISNPEVPVEISHLKTGKQAGQILVSDSLVYVIDWQLPLKTGQTQHWLEVIDASEAQQPSLLDSISLESDSQSYHIVGVNGFLYWFGTSNNIEIVQIFLN